MATIPAPKPPRATSSRLKAVMRDEPGPPKEKTSIRGPGVKVVVTTSYQAMISGEGQASPLCKVRSNPDGDGMIIEGVDYPLTSVPRKEVMVFIRSRNIFHEFAFDVFCATKRCPHVHGHVPSWYYAPACRAWLRRDPVLQLGGEAPPMGCWGRS